MSTQLDDVVSAFADLQKAIDNLHDDKTKTAINEATDALLMAVGTIEFRLNSLEKKSAQLSAGTVPSSNLRKLG
jgi:hypothetical protein